jgi:hypothetical protein
VGRTYVVKEGDSPARIASRDDMAGCPKCSVDLVRANPQKPTVRHPNGFVTFRELGVGEVLNLPDSWFHPARESLPPTYYKILPHANGVTRGTLGDFPELDTAVTRVAELAAMDDAAFAQAVGDASSKIDAAVTEAYKSAHSPDAAAKAQAVKSSTSWAWQRNRDLAAAIAAGDKTAITRARLDIQNALATALGNARLAIVAHYPTTGPTAASASLQAAAKAAAQAIAADANYCTSVTHPGTPVNAAVHRFKLAWNASQTTKVPLDTGNYETQTTVALAQVLGSAPSACGPGMQPVPAPKPPPPKQDDAPVKNSGWSGWTIAAIVVVSGAAAGGIAFLATRDKPTRKLAPAYA